MESTDLANPFLGDAVKVGYGPQCQPFLSKSEDGEIAILVQGPVRNRGAGPAAVAARSLLGAGGNQERSAARVAAALVRKVPALAGSQVPVADALSFSPGSLHGSRGRLDQTGRVPSWRQGGRPYTGAND